MCGSSRRSTAWPWIGERIASMRPRSRRKGGPRPRCSSSRPWRIRVLAALFAALVLLPASAWAYRPFVSTDAAVADPHEVEIELGYFTLEHDTGENTFIIPSLVLNYGLRRDLEVVGEFRRERAPTG